MKHLYILLSLGYLLNVNLAFGQSIEVIDFITLEKIINQENGNVKLINFWATWCKPCIKELPYFEAVNAKYGAQVEVILVSLDFASELDSKLIPYVNRKALKSRVLLLDDVDYNSWIDLVYPSWSGAIPATLVIGKDRNNRTFYEGELEENQLENMLKEYLQ